MEFVARLCLLGQLFLRSNNLGVFPLSICFTNLIATAALGLFFQLLFMTPIYAHSPAYRGFAKKEHSTAFLIVEWLTYLAGVPCMRLLSSGFLGLPALRSDLHSYRPFSGPLNLVSNYSLLFSLS